MKSIMKHYKHKFQNIKDLLQKDNPVIIEIGSHYGEDSVRFAETFKDIKLYCFEPDPRNIEIHNKHIDDKRIKLFEIALSTEDGEAEFYQSYKDDKIPERVFEKYDWISEEDYVDKKLNNSGASSLKKGYKNVLSKTITVKTQRFDNWYKENNVGEIDFCWIDVQGAEKDVFDGMGDDIKHIKYIWVEYGETGYDDGMSRDETISYLNSKDFFIISKLSSHEAQGDLLFENERLD